MRVSTPQELGLLVRERRHELRLSQAELARRAGVGRPWLVAVERGHVRAELGKLLSLLAELGLSLDATALDTPAPDAAAGVEPGVDLDELLREFDRRTRPRP
jgi:HTH-type transcriptional regulator/antitoxin HipB